ncbi:GroES-like [Phytophthora cactorum]|nr:GroES-like [Phytophthora cactorum]
MTDETEVETVSRIQAVDIRDLYPDRAPEDSTSRVCLLCGAKLKDKTHNLTRHLERHHAGALLQLLEQRNQASPRVLASRTRRTHQEKAAARQPTEQVADSVLKAGDAKLALAKWLAQEQLPVDLIEKSGFREFMEVLNEQFSPPKREELRQLLGTLVAGTDDSKLTGFGDSDMMTDGDDAPSTVEMMALRATCRCNEDSPLVSCSRVACDLVDSHTAKVKVLRAAASLFDAQTCRGKILGKNGVLGRSFVGVVTEMQPSVSEEMSAADPVKLFDKVVASPFIFDAVPIINEQHEEDTRKTKPIAHSIPPTAAPPVGALAEYIVLPVSNLSVVPAAVPDDLALLSDDMSVVLSIASELQRRQVTNIAILSDGPSAILSNLLTRYLHQDVQFAPQNLHVFSTSTVSTSVWSQHVSLTPLDIYQPAATELALDAIVDLIGCEASVEFATSLVQSMGCVVLVDRSRLELHPRSTIPMDMNSVVVRELEYLVTQAQNQQSATELRECLLDGVELSQALHELQSIPERTLEARYLQVTLT